MRRVETEQSALSSKILSKLYNITFNCKKQTGIYQISLSKSTRSIYVSYLSFENNTAFKLRISDHRPSFKWECDADVFTTFEDFNADFKSILKNLKSLNNA